jgi:5'-methylthioadenosine phosphorylase
MSTDYDCWREGEESVTWETIVQMMQKNADNVIKLFLEVIPQIRAYDDVCIK